MLRYFNLWLSLGVLLVVIVCYLSLMPSPPDFNIEFKFLDKLKHIWAYFVLMFWFAQLYRSGRARLLYGLSFILLGIILEIAQSFEPTRFFELADMLANTIGIALAWLVTKGKLKNALVIFERKVFG